MTGEAATCGFASPTGSRHADSRASSVAALLHSAGEPLAPADRAFDAARLCGGSVRLGVRHFDDPAARLTWCPGIPEDGATPTWLLLDDGAVLFPHSGPLTPAALVAAIKTAFPGV